MDPLRFSFIKLFTLSLPLFCLLSCSWGEASTAVPHLLPRSSATLAADTLRSRGYSIFASLMVSVSATTNYTGTLLAPPDYVFSFASARFLNSHSPPPRPSIPLLFYHTLGPPLILTWPALSTRDDGEELRHFFNRNCLFLLRTAYGEVTISSSPFRNPVTAVKIRQPDLYVDERLIVHGIDGVLDPSFATKCSVPYLEPSADAVSLQVSRLFLDRALRGLWRKGYNVVAAAMVTRRSDLLSLTSVTVFAVSDEHLFMRPGGFRYDFRHHVVPMRLRYSDFERAAAGGMELFTLAPNKTLVVESVDGAVTVDGVALSMTEVYHNRWVVVLSIVSSLDDGADYRPNPPITGAVSTEWSPSPSPLSSLGVTKEVPSPAPTYNEDFPWVRPIDDGIYGKSVPPPSPFSGVNIVPSPAQAFTDASREIPPISSAFWDVPVPTPSPFSRVSKKRNACRNPSPSPSYIDEIEYDIEIMEPANVYDGFIDADPVETPSPAPTIVDGIGDNAPSSPAPTPETEIEENPVASPTPSPATDDISYGRCRSRGVEEGDLLCADGGARRLLNNDRQYAEDFTQFYKGKITENVNIADDVFFYI